VNAGLGLRSCASPVSHQASIFICTLRERALPSFSRFFLCTLLYSQIHTATMMRLFRRFRPSSVTNLHSKLVDLASALWNSSDSWIFGFVEVVSVGTVGSY
jgi:hypothetical protein